MANDANNLVCNIFHFVKKLVEGANKFHLCRVEREPILTGIEAHLGVDVVTLGVVHLIEDKLDRLLVNLDLSLSNHVINQANEGPKAVVVLASQA